MYPLLNNYYNIIIMFTVSNVPFTKVLLSFIFRVEVRDCAKIVKVVIEKVDDRNAERIMRTEIQDRFVIKSPPTDVPVIS